MAETDTGVSVANARARKSVLVSILCALALAYLFAGWSRASWIVAMDQGFFELFGAMTRQSWALDTLIVQIFRTDTAKILPMLACIVWLIVEHRRQGKSTAFFGQLLLGSLIAMSTSRLMQNLSAHRPRPLHEDAVNYRLPYGIDDTTLEGWSSFPSDTVALAVSIAAGIVIASRRLGIAALMWTIVVVAFPRGYAGLHYPSDLIGGALIGWIATIGIAPLMLHAVPERAIPRIDERHWPWLWSLAFLYMFQLASMFEDVRFYGAFAATVLGL